MIPEFLNKPGYTQADLQLLIDTHAEEFQHLEFKAGGALENDDRKKNELSKDISAMANADGGLIIYGVDESNTHHAERFAYVDGNLFGKEWLENVIQAKVSRPIPGLQIFPVRFNDDITQSVYLIKIPRSIQAPHMAADGKYYKRLNFKVQTMAEYEVRESYLRTGIADIRIDDLNIQESSSNGQAGKVQWADFMLVFRLTNNGGGIAEHYKLEVRVPKAIHKTMMHSNIKPDRFVDDEVIYSFPNNSPLFQQETTTAGQVMVQLSALHKQHLDTPVVAKVYHTGGTTETSFTLRGRLTYAGRLLEDQL